MRVMRFHRQKRFGSFFVVLCLAVCVGVVAAYGVLKNIVGQSLEKRLQTSVKQNLLSLLAEPDQSWLTSLPGQPIDGQAEISQNISLEIAKQIQDSLTKPYSTDSSVLQSLHLIPNTPASSGIRLSQLTSDSTTVSSTGKVLSVDKDGFIVLVNDRDTAGEVTENHTNYTTNTITLDDLYSPYLGSTLYYSGSEWVTSTNLFNNGSRIGLHTTSPQAILHLLSNSTDTTTMVIQGASSQTSPLLDLLDSSGISVASISASGKLVLGNSDDDHSLELYPVLEIEPGGDAGELSSSGGALYLNNTRNEGSGINIFSDAGAEADGHLLNIKANNAAFTKGSIYVDHKGTGNAVNVTHNGSTSTGNAVSITNNNTQDSALGVIGYETGRGTVKITHNGTGTDANASGLSIDLQGSGTHAQGLYVDSTAATGTQGNLLRLRNQTVDRFVVNSLGSLTIGTTGTDTFISKKGNNANDEFYVGTNGAFRVQRSASDSEAFRVQISGDTQGRWLGTSDGKLKWGDGSSTQDIVLRRSAAATLLLDTARLQIKSASLNSDLLTFTSTSSTRLGRFLETSGGYGWFEISDNAAQTKIVFRADSGVSYLNAGNVGIGSTAASAKLHVVSTSEQFRLSYDSSNHAQFSVSSGGLLTLTPTAGLSVGSSVAIGTTSFGTNAANVLALANSTAPSAAITDGIQLFAVDEAGSHELRVMDEAGFTTTLSPHNFSLIPGGQSESLAWGFYSERQGLAINADVTKALRLLEEMSGEQLVFIKDLQTNQYLNQPLPKTDYEQFQQPIPSYLTVEEFEKKLDQFVTDEELKQTFSLKDAIVEFFRAATFHARVLFTDVTEFASEVIFRDHLTVGTDTAGIVEIPEGVTKAKVSFSKSYSQIPTIYLTSPDANTAYQLAEVSREGFVINIPSAQPEKIVIHWLAIITNAATSIEILEQTTPSNSPQNVPIVIDSPQPSSNSASTTSAELTQ